MSTVNFEVVRCPLCGSDEAYPLLGWRNRTMVLVYLGLKANDQVLLDRLVPRLRLGAART